MRLPPTEVIENVLDYYDTNVVEGGKIIGKMFDLTNSEKAEQIWRALQKHGAAYA